MGMMAIIGVLPNDGGKRTQASALPRHVRIAAAR
jgi:hypothetical protein